MGELIAVLLMVGSVAVYFLPSLIAGAREHHQGAAIFLVNALLGWTAIGWIAALVWSATATDGPERRRAKEAARRAVLEEPSEGDDSGRLRTDRDPDRSGGVYRID